jgi:hypothetical protein
VTLASGDFARNKGQALVSRPAPAIKAPYVDRIDDEEAKSEEKLGDGVLQMVVG